ncbi:MAG: L-2-hydroxyglutarate oxidase [Chloroflexi bacterium]|nr:L-2-hydroxyglutarate oxidase [Chloroflexota bacterium]
MGQTYDVAVVGAGIVGLATTLALLKRRPGLRITVLDKEAEVAAHQTGHNSGVIHSGIYYKPGSLKAKLCVSGARQMTVFCDAHGIKYERIGKLIVATDEREMPALQTLSERAVANGVPGVTFIGLERMRDIEPHARGVAALHSPNTGIVDYKEVSQAMRRDAEAAGATFQMGAAVHGIARAAPGVRVQTRHGEVTAKYVVNCAGLHCDAVARMFGERVDVRVVPFRGEYYLIKPEKHDLVRGLIYPVPDPRFPFLGVHFTRTVHGEVEAGPNAVLAFAREGYTMGRISPGDLAGTLTYGGFWKMAAKYWRMGLGEFHRSFSKREFVHSLQKMVPDIGEADVFRGGAGVRAQAIDTNGALVDDFRLVETPIALHVLNAPSPAATASLAIGEYIAARAQI